MQMLEQKRNFYTRMKVNLNLENYSDKKKVKRVKKERIKRRLSAIKKEEEVQKAQVRQEVRQEVRTRWRCCLGQKAQVQKEEVRQKAQVQEGQDDQEGLSGRSL